MKNRININWEWITETVRAKKRGFLLFLAGIVFLVILLFWDGTILQVEESASDPAPETQQEITTENQKQAGKNTKTTCWFWQGRESGVPSKEYLTLCEDDQTYILMIELQGRNPVEVTGKYHQSDGNLQFWRDHKQISGTISKTQVILEEKTYEKTQCGHI